MIKGFEIVTHSGYDGDHREWDWYSNIEAARLQLAYLIWQNDCSYISYRIEEIEVEDESAGDLADVALLAWWSPATARIHEIIVDHNMRTSADFLAYHKEHGLGAGFNDDEK